MVPALALTEAALRAAHDPLVVMSRTGIIQFASERIADASGFTASELRGQAVQVLLPPRLHGVFNRFLTEFFTNPTARHVGYAEPLFFLHKDGQERRIEFGISAFESEGELYAVCTLHDAPARPPVEHNTKMALERLETRLSNALQDVEILIAHAPAAIAVLDRDMRYMLVSRRWMEDFKLEGNITGKRHYDVIPNQPDRWKHMHARCLQGETFFSEEESYVCPDGRVEIIRWELVPWRDVENQIGGLMIFSELITQRKRAEIALREHHDLLETQVTERTAQLERSRDEALRANADKTRFIAGISHDLRQPLQAATLLLSALQRRVSPDLSGLCGKIETAISEASKKLSGLMDASRLEEGVLQPRIAPFEIGPLLQQVARTHYPMVEAKGLELVVEECAAIGASDTLLLARIIDNFISNAVKYTRVGEIKVGCAIVGDAARIYVADTGAGLDDAGMMRVFDPYVQLDDASAGYGLGLAICRTIADALHCQLNVTSEVGHGSVFSVTIPLATADATAAE